MDLLDAEIAPPSSDVLAAELGRLDVPADEHYLDRRGPLRFTADTEEEPSPLAAAGGRKVAVGIAGLLAVALVGLLIGISALGGDDKDPQHRAGRRRRPPARRSGEATPGRRRRPQAGRRRTSGSSTRTAGTATSSTTPTR